MFRKLHPLICLLLVVFFLTLYRGILFTFFFVTRTMSFWTGAHFIIFESHSVKFCMLITCKISITNHTTGIILQTNLLFFCFTKTPLFSILFSSVKKKSRLLAHCMCFSRHLPNVSTGGGAGVQ